MRHSVPILILVSCVALALPIAAQVPATFTNLQVLPKDIRQRPLVDLMRSFALGLGVRCEFCHVGEGNDLSKFDFASDARPQKLTARKMLKMLAAVNEQLAGVGDPPAAGAARVTCFTCHRGARKPATAPAGLAASPSSPSARR